MVISYSGERVLGNKVSRGGVVVAWVMMVLGAMVGCVTNPATGQKSFNVISPAEEVRLGTQAAPQFLNDYGGEIPSAKILGYVRGLGQRLAAQSERANLPWEFHVVDSGVLNAFALPGGKVFISRGLLAKLSSEAELAGVLGHEIGHVTAQHQAQQMSQAMVVSGIVAGAGIAGERSNKEWMKVLGTGTQVGGSLYLLKFGRDQESQADELGVRYMTKLGYQPRGQIRVMEVLRAEAGNSPGQLEILSTHPAPQSRIERLEKHIAERYPQAENSGSYEWKQEEYQVTVLEELKRLPAPKHR